MTDRVHPDAIKAVADRCVLEFINFWLKHGFLNSVNHAAKHFGVTGYNSIFEYWRGDITLVAEPPGFSGGQTASRPFLHGSPHSTRRVFRTRGNQENTAGQAAHLLCNGKLWHARDRR